MIALLPEHQVQISYTFGFVGDSTTPKCEFFDKDTSIYSVILIYSGYTQDVA
jgi:hypothetical protein